MTANLTAWEFCDAWFLESVAMSTDGPDDFADLSAVLGAGDAINKAIFNLDEVEHAVSLLVPAGLLREEQQTFALTREGRALAERAEAANEFAFDAAEWIEGQLCELDVPTPVTWRLPRRAMRSAYRAYNKRFNRIEKQIVREELERYRRLRPD